MNRKHFSSIRFFLSSLLVIFVYTNSFAWLKDDEDRYIVKDGIRYEIVNPYEVHVTDYGNTLDEAGLYSGEIIIPENIIINGKNYIVSAIGHRAFLYASNLKSVRLPSTIVSIEEVAFCHSGIESISIPNSVRYLGRKAFFRCFSLTTVELSDSIKSILSHTFEDCSSLSTVIIPNSIETIGLEAFKGCESLSSVTIPSKAILGKDAFDANTTVIKR